ncbi:hypothetical protein [Vallitalea guaymasensis]|uniref:hypothetical protein n=2 Tax=Vallitalea guaymasensis TaxID=1185412 RepID=UPI000DE2F57F|nr:hypothetical protein [Vallitalea guaymasensis]
MSKLKEDIIKERFEQVKTGRYFPNIKSVDGLVFIKLSGHEKSQASRIYSKELMKLHKEGGLYSEALLESVLKNLCEEQGIDYTAVISARKLYERAFKRMPVELRDIKKLTQDEIVKLSKEEQKKVLGDIKKKTEKASKYFEQCFSDEEKVIVEEAKRVEQLESELRLNTYEHYAKKAQIRFELFLSARLEENIESKYFKEESEIEELDQLIQKNLYEKFISFRNGASDNFLSK